MKVFNGFSGAGGNRKLWENVDVTAVEINPKIAEIYQDFFPEDTVIVGDAHQYLLEHFKEFEFIWVSPPCPTHSQVRYRLGVLNGVAEPVYPDMRLYQEILFLKHHFKGKWVVENTEPYYKPLIRPQKCGRHRIWANFVVTDLCEEGKGVTRWGSLDDMEKLKDVDLSKYSNIDKRTILRNCVNPETGLHIFNCAFKHQQIELMTVEAKET